MQVKMCSEAVVFVGIYSNHNISFTAVFEVLFGTYELE